MIAFGPGELIEHWVLICLDLHATYGIDLADPVYMDRGCLWLRSRIYDLVGLPGTRVNHALTVKKE